MGNIDALILKRKAILDRIKSAENFKKEIIEKVQRLASDFSSGKITFFDYHQLLKNNFGEKTPEEWNRYYDNYIYQCNEKLKKLNNEIFKIKSANLIKKASPIAVVLALVFLSYFFVFNIKTPVLFSPMQDYFEEVDYTFNASSEIIFDIENAGRLESLKMSGEIQGEGSVKVHLTGNDKDILILDSQNIENSNNYTTYSSDFSNGQFPKRQNIIKETAHIKSAENAITGKVVEVLNNFIENSGNYSTNSQNFLMDNSEKRFLINRIIHNETKNYSANDTDYSIDNNKVITDINDTEDNFNVSIDAIINRDDNKINVKNNDKIIKYFKNYCEESCDLFDYNLSSEQYKIKIEIRGNVKIKINRINYEIVTEPETNQNNAVSNEIKKNEKETNKGKEVRVLSSPGKKNIEINTKVSENWKIREKDEIQVYWKEGGEYIDFSTVDLDGDGLIDEILWNADDLERNQTYEIIIITDAMHLDENRNFISNIYESVKEKEGMWSESIADGEYVRVTFEIPLDNTRDITIWSRTISGTPRVEVYEKDSEFRSFYCTCCKCDADFWL